MEINELKIDELTMNCRIILLKKFSELQEYTDN